MPSVTHYIDAEGSEIEVVMRYDWYAPMPQTLVDEASGGPEPYELTICGHEVELADYEELLKRMTELAWEKQLDPDDGL